MEGGFSHYRIHNNDINSREFITRRMRYVAVLLRHFRKRFNKEYLLPLREFHNLAMKECSFDVISKGTVVSVQENNQPRGSWKLGIIEEVHTGNDGKRMQGKGDH